MELKFPQLIFEKWIQSSSNDVLCIFSDPCHISSEEIAQVAKLIRTLQIRQSMMSEITILSDDSLCPICYAKGISAEFYPCKHQSCSNCILQHMINSKVCYIVISK